MYTELVKLCFKKQLSIKASQFFRQHDLCGVKVRGGGFNENRGVEYTVPVDDLKLLRYFDSRLSFDDQTPPLAITVNEVPHHIINVLLEAIYNRGLVCSEENVMEYYHASNFMQFKTGTNAAVAFVVSLSRGQPEQAMLFTDQMIAPDQVLAAAGMAPYVIWWPHLHQVQYLASYGCGHSGLAFSSGLLMLSKAVNGMVQEVTDDKLAEMAKFAVAGMSMKMGPERKQWSEVRKFHGIRLRQAVDSAVADALSLGDKYFNNSPSINRLVFLYDGSTTTFHSKPPFTDVEVTSAGLKFQYKSDPNHFRAFVMTSITSTGDAVNEFYNVCGHQETVSIHCKTKVDINMLFVLCSLRCDADLYGLAERCKYMLQKGTDDYKFTRTISCNEGPESGSDSESASESDTD